MRPDLPNAPQYIMDITPAKEELGYEPRYDYISLLKDFKMEYVRKREKPNIKLISDMEIKYALIISLILNMSLNENDLMKTAATLLGYHSLSKVFKTRCNPLLNSLKVDTFNYNEEGYTLKSEVLNQYKKYF